MYLLQYLHLLLLLVLFLYCQIQNSANGSSNNSTSKSIQQLTVKNATFKFNVSKPNDPLKTESSERSYMRSFGAKYELPIIFQTGKFYTDDQDNHNRLPDGDFNNNSNGFYNAKRDNSKKMFDNEQNSIGRNAVKSHRRPMPPFAADFKVPDTDNNGDFQRESGCRCDCPNNDPYQVLHRSYQEKGNDEEREVKIDVEFGSGGNDENNDEDHLKTGDNENNDSDMGRIEIDPKSSSPEKNSEDDYNNHKNHFVGKWKWKHQPTSNNNQEFGNSDNGSQQNDNGNSDDQPQQQQQRQQAGNSKGTSFSQVGVACDFSKSNCDFENDRYDESRFRYGYNVFFKGKLWYIDHFPQRRFPGPSGQQSVQGWGRLMSPVYEVPQNSGRLDACMLLEFEFDSEGSDHLTVMLQESDNSRVILDYLRNQPNERDSLLLRKYVHFIVTGKEVRFFIQFTFDTKQQSSQYGVRTFEFYWEACPFGKVLTNTMPNRPMAIEFVQR